MEDITKPQQNHEYLPLTPEELARKHQLEENSTWTTQDLSLTAMKGGITGLFIIGAITAVSFWLINNMI